MTLIFITAISSQLSRLGITKVAAEFLGYKMNQIVYKCDSELEFTKQYNKGKNNYSTLIKNNILEYAKSIIKEDIESFIAIDKSGIIQMSTSIAFDVGEEINFFSKLQSSEKPWIEFNNSGSNRVGFFIYYEPWNYYFILSSFSNIFYLDANKMTQTSIIILLICLVLISLLLIYFINYFLVPLKEIIDTMDYIVDSGETSKRVKIRYNDEIGDMGFSFNSMLDRIEQADNTIREYAFTSVLQQKREERIRTMFQKYVPQDVIDDIIYNPERALEGKNSNVCILFSDIRSFTSISESMQPDKLVESLNNYFNIMVNIIYKHNGVIDKYIGDAIMAIFGAPKAHDDDVQNSVMAALEMIDMLEIFNKEQKEQGLCEFNIGIGLNYGIVTVGNIGSSRKMDYTVIGDSVNLASRLEGLTKDYHVPIVISESIFEKTRKFFYVREIDRVRVKGKNKPVKIFQPARKLPIEIKKGWTIFNNAVKQYQAMNFPESKELFIIAKKYLPNDLLCEKYIEQIEHYKKNPPPENWDGVTTMTHK